MFIHFKRQLGREAAGNTAPGVPTRPGVIRPMPILGTAYPPTLAARWQMAARRGLLGEKAAVDDEFGASDERAFVGGEEQHPVGDLDRLADAPVAAA